MVCGLIGGTILAFRQGSEIPFVYGRVKTSNAGPLAIELNQSCSGQVHFKGPSTGSRNIKQKIDVLLSAPCSIYNSSTEPCGCLVQIGYLVVSA